MKSIQVNRFQLILLLIPSFKPWLNISCSWISWFPYIQSSRSDPICYHIKNHLTYLSHDHVISFDFLDLLKAWLYSILFVYFLFKLDPYRKINSPSIPARIERNQTQTQKSLQISWILFRFPDFSYSSYLFLLCLAY